MRHRSKSPFSGIAIVLAAATFFAFGAAAPAQTGLSTFFVLPDGNGGPGSESMISGSIAPIGGGAFVGVNADVTADQRINRNGYLTLEADPIISGLWHAIDVHLTAIDAATGAQLLLTRAAAGPDSWVSSSPTGYFEDGSVITTSIAVTVTATGGGLTGVTPSTATLAVTGTVVPGYFHSVLHLAGGLTGLPGLNVSLFVKEDFHPPNVLWDGSADTAASSAVRTGVTGSGSVGGGCGLERDPLSKCHFFLKDWSLTVSGTPAVTITAPPGQYAGSVLLDPHTRAVSGTLNVLINGTLVTRVLNGIGESFTGPCAMPTSLTIDESNLPGLSHLIIVFRKVEIIPGVGNVGIGTSTNVLMRGRPGTHFIAAATLNPVPGINTMVGDIFVSVDDLFIFSMTPNNGIFVGFDGIMPARGTSSLTINMPYDPALVGITAFVAGTTLNSTTGEPTGVTNSFRVIVQ